MDNKTTQSWYSKGSGKLIIGCAVTFILVIICIIGVGLAALFVFPSSSNTPEIADVVIEHEESSVTEVNVEIEENKVQEKPQTLSEKFELIQQLDLLQNTEVTSRLDEENPNAIVELLVDSGEVTIIDLTDITIDAPDHYRPLFELLNDFGQDAVTFELIDVELSEIEDDWWTYEAVLPKLKYGETVYTTEIFFSPDYYPVDTYYFQVVNRMLADANSDYRFFAVTIFCEDENCDTNIYVGNGPVDKDKFGLILLTQNQAEVIDQNDLLPICCREFDIVKASEVNKVLGEYHGLGFFDGMDENYVEAKRNKILRNQLYGRDEIIYYFDDLFYNFDTETSNFENPYEEITLELIKISKGKFQPTSIVDKYEYDTNSEFSFVLNDSKYETVLESYSDWLDLSFIELMNRALQEQGVDGQFYAIDTGDQTATIIFLTQTQFEEIQTKQLMALLNIGDTTAVEDGQEFEEQVLEELLEENE